MRKIASLCILFALAASVSSAPAQVRLIPLPNFGPNGDGTVRPGDVSFLTSTGSRLQRGMAFNPATGHLIVVNRDPVDAPTLSVIDALTGIYVGDLDQSSIYSGGAANFLYNQIGIAEDGAIYVGNLTTSGTLVEFNLYRWASEASPQTHVYFGNPGNTTVGGSRWGDTMAVRGSGMDTEVLLATQNGALAAILRPSVSDLSVFTNAPLNAAIPAGGLGYGLAFAGGNTFYGKAASVAGAPLYLMSYDVNAASATPLYTFGINAFPGTAGPLGTLIASNWLACIADLNSTNPHKLRLFDISTPSSTPALLDRISVPNWTNANGVYGGAIAFGFGTNLYALDSDNGIAAFTIVSGTDQLAPYVFGQPASRLVFMSSTATCTVGVDGSPTLAYQWLKNSSPITDGTTSALSLNNCQTTDAASYAVVVTNDYGAVTSSVAVLTVIPNYGNTAVWDPFAYAPDSLLAGQGSWVLKSTAENGHIEAGNLSVPGLIPSYGNRYTYTGNNSVRWMFSPEKTNGAIYFSFAMRIDDIGTSTGSETMAGFAMGTTTSFPLKITIQGDGSGTRYQVGIYKSSGTTSGAMAPDWFTANDTVFVVARYTFRPDTTTDDTCDLWLNPPPATFGEVAPPTPTLADQGAGRADLAYTDAFMWRFASGYPKRTVDEFRLGFSWADVTPPGPPQLSVALDGPDVVVSWSTNTPPSFTLESIKGLDDLDGWQTETTAAVVDGANYTVRLAHNRKTMLFRLKK